MSYRDYDRLKKALERLEIAKEVASIFNGTIYIHQIDEYYKQEDIASTRKNAATLMDQQYEKIISIVEEMIIKIEKKEAKDND